MSMQQNKVSYPHTANDFLQHAAGTLGERGKQYDVGGKQERSMAKIVAAFNAVHDANGAQLTEQQGWAFMMLLKMVRGAHAPHLDSALDAVGYAALYGECVAEQLVGQEAKMATLQGSITHVEKAAMFGSEPVLYAYKGMATHMRNRVAELEAMLREALDKQAIIENRNDNLAAQLGEANAGYEHLQYKLRSVDGRYEAECYAHGKAAERNNELMTNVGELRDKLRFAGEALSLSSAARYDEIERNKMLILRNDELHTELSQALKELKEIRAECAARGEQLHAVRNKYDRLLDLVKHIDHQARLCAPMQDRLDAILKLTANA